MVQVRADVPLAPAEPPGPSGEAQGERQAVLDRLKGISDPRAGCLRWPEHVRLVAESSGELIEGRCKATNKCPYCQARFVAETVEALLLDAAYGPGPTVYVVLTAREHLTRAQTYDHLQQLRRSLRKRWPSLEWFVQVEFQLRGALHLNLLVKGVEAAERDELLERACAIWCNRVDAEPVGQWAGEVLADYGGLAKYLGKRFGHGLKSEQAPPLGWRGHRTSQTRGYFNRPVTELRAEARRNFRHRALIRRAIAEGFAAEDAELLVAEQERQADAESWRLIDVTSRLTASTRVKPTSATASVPSCVVQAACAFELERELQPWNVPDLEAGLWHPPRRDVTAPEGQNERSSGELPSGQPDAAREAQTGLVGPSRWFRPAVFDRARLMRRLRLLDRWANGEPVADGWSDASGERGAARRRAPSAARPSPAYPPRARTERSEVAAKAKRSPPRAARPAHESAPPPS